MGDLFYETIHLIGRSAFFVSSVPVVRGAEHTRREGAYLLASTHQAPYDVPLIMRHAARRVDFVSIAEVFRFKPLGWFYGSMNAFPLDRSRPDLKAVRTIYDRLERGRVVGIFPEGGFRKGDASVVYTKKIKPGIGRIAKTANVPIVPCVIIGSERYAKFKSWLPTRSVQYGIQFGEAIQPDAEPAAIEAALVDRFVALHADLATHIADRASRQTSR